MTALNSQTLPQLERDELAVPQYDRSAVRTGIVHFGVGGFHRAHEAMYLDRPDERGPRLDWGICGVGLLPGDARMRDVLASPGLPVHPGGQGTGRHLGPRG